MMQGSEQFGTPESKMIIKCHSKSGQGDLTSVISSLFEFIFILIRILILSKHTETLHSEER